MGAVSDVVADLAWVRDAFERPTLRLLHKPQAALVLTVFRTAFGRDMSSVPADRLHTQVDVYLGELRQIGQDTPKGSGRDLCRKWMREQWLTRYDDDGTDRPGTRPGRIGGTSVQRVAGRGPPPRRSPWPAAPGHVAGP